MGTNIQPGPNPEYTVAARNFLRAVHTADVKGVMIDSTARDTGNTPTTTLRAGLFLGLRNETSMFVEYDDDGTNDGRRVARGILMKDINLLDENATARDTPANMLVAGRVDPGECFGADDNGWTDLADPTNGCNILKDSDIEDYSSSSSLSSSSSSSSSS